MSVAKKAAKKTVESKKSSNPTIAEVRRAPVPENLSLIARATRQALGSTGEEARDGTAGDCLVQMLATFEGERGVIYDGILRIADEIETMRVAIDSAREVLSATTVSNVLFSLQRRLEALAEISSMIDNAAEQVHAVDLHTAETAVAS